METTYEEFIQNILDTRGRFACGDEYHERHHIVPRCMDGSNNRENLIDLYAREHFVATNPARADTLFPCGKHHMRANNGGIRLTGFITGHEIVLP